MAEYWYGLTCIISKETYLTTKDLMIEHIQVVARGAIERPWEVFRSFSEEVCARVMNPTNTHVTLSDREE